MKREWSNLPTRIPRVPGFKQIRKNVQLMAHESLRKITNYAIRNLPKYTELDDYSRFIYHPKVFTLIGYVNTHGVSLEFCIKESHASSSSAGIETATTWPKGSYCILKYGACPTGKYSRVSDYMFEINFIVLSLFLNQILCLTTC